MTWEEPSGSIEFPYTPLSQINLVFHSAHEEDEETHRSVPLFSEQPKYPLNSGDILQL